MDLQVLGINQFLGPTSSWATKTFRTGGGTRGLVIPRAVEEVKLPLHRRVQILVATLGDADLSWLSQGFPIEFITHNDYNPHLANEPEERYRIAVNETGQLLDRWPHFHPSGVYSQGKVWKALCRPAVHEVLHCQKRCWLGPFYSCSTKTTSTIGLSGCCGGDTS